MEDRSNENERLEDDCEAFRKDLSRLLYRPRARLDEDNESSLSVIPWTIHFMQENSTGPSNESDDPTPKAMVFPSPSYLDLRRQQNIQFADEQAAKDQDPSAWKQALQLVPDHVPSLVAYAKYCLETNKLEQAERLLRDAVSIDGKHAFAHRLLSELDEKQHSKNRHHPYKTSRPHVPNQTTSTSHLKTRESSAYQDALLERQLLASPKDDDNNDHSDKEHDDHHSDESIDHKHERKKRRKKRRKHRRKRRHRYLDSSGSDSDSSVDRRRRERKRRKKKKYHRRSRDDSTASRE